MGAPDVPFCDGILEMFKGIGGPMVPGIHGVVVETNPSSDAIETLTKIRDMCDDVLCRLDKGPEDTESKGDSDEFSRDSKERESKSESKEQGKDDSKDEQQEWK